MGAGVERTFFLCRPSGLELPLSYPLQPSDEEYRSYAQIFHMQLCLTYLHHIDRPFNLLDWAVISNMTNIHAGLAFPAFISDKQSMKILQS